MIVVRRSEEILGHDENKGLLSAACPKDIFVAIIEQL